MLNFLLSKILNSESSLLAINTAIWKIGKQQPKLHTMQQISNESVYVEFPLGLLKCIHTQNVLEVLVKGKSFCFPSSWMPQEYPIMPQGPFNGNLI